MFMLVLGIVGGVAYFNKIQNSKSQISNNKTEIIAETPKETPKIQEEPQSYKIEILNASGVTGMAAEAAKKIDARVQILDEVKVEITTGNAASQTGTTIAYKVDNLRRSSIGAALSELYPSAKVSTDIALVVDIKIVIGK